MANSDQQDPPPLVVPEGSEVLPRSPPSDKSLPLSSNPIPRLFLSLSTCVGALFSAPAVDASCQKDPPPEDLGISPQSPPPAGSDPQAERLTRDLQDLAVGEGKDDKDSGSEGSEEKEEEKGEEEGGKENGKKGQFRGPKPFYPRRPREPDCASYPKKGKSAFGNKCNFEHPRPGGRRNQYFDTPGGCKHGSTRRYNHGEEKEESQPLKLNFLGLPLRPGEKECHFYMRNGSCKFSASCKYHHPDPSASAKSGIQQEHFSSGSPLFNVSNAPQIPGQFHAPHIPPPNSYPFMHGPPYVSPMPVAPQTAPQPPLPLIPGWNQYQPPGVPSFAMDAHGRYNTIPSVQEPSMISNCNTNQQQIQDMELPQRPGQPDCSYYMKFGYCKFKLGCKFNHPKNRLPSRPGQAVCTHYSRFGICKFGPSCIYDHPADQLSSKTMTQQRGRMNRC